MTDRRECTKCGTVTGLNPDGVRTIVVRVDAELDRCDGNHNFQPVGGGADGGGAGEKRLRADDMGDAAKKAKSGPLLPEHVLGGAATPALTAAAAASDTSHPPLDLASFAEIRNGGFVYVDKTAFIGEMVNRGRKFFLSRPRKFGKSMVLSTLEAFFMNRHGLFAGLAVSNQPPKLLGGSTWSETTAPFPVIKVDFSAITFSKGRDVFENAVVSCLADIGSSYGVNVDKGTVKEALKQTVYNLANDTRNEHRKVVVLIDEYDAPIVKVLEDLREEAVKCAQDNRAVLAEFFTTLKALEEYIAFEFVTGVTKFAQVSLFSGGNDLIDITLDKEFSSLCGFTWTEIEETFKDALRRQTASSGRSLDDVKADIIRWYNGYSWLGDDKVFNPYSICKLMSEDKMRFKPFWIEKGRTSWLIDLTKSRVHELIRASNDCLVEETFLSSIDVSCLGEDSASLRSLLFQTGYLTVAGETEDADGSPRLSLAVPNLEVRRALFVSLWGHIFGKPADQVSERCSKLKAALTQGDLKTFVLEFNADLNTIPHFAASRTAAFEGYYQSLLHVTVRMLGLPFRSEEATIAGRSDMWISTENNLFFVELKRTENKTERGWKTDVEGAVAQVFENKYFDGHAELATKQCFSVGLVFSIKSRLAVALKWQKFAHTAAHGVAKEDASSNKFFH